MIVAAHVLLRKRQLRHLTRRLLWRLDALLRLIGRTPQVNGASLIRPLDPVVHSILALDTPIHV